MMICPDCKEYDIAVIASRLPNSGMYTRRRLKCNSCESRFTSYELRALDLKEPGRAYFFQKLDEIRERKRLADPFKRYLPPEEPILPRHGWINRSRALIRDCCSYIN